MYSINAAFSRTEWVNAPYPSCQWSNCWKHLFSLIHLAAAGLDGLDQIREANRRMQRGQDVNMVFNPVETEHMTFVILDDAPDVAEQIFAARFVQHALAIFRREDDVINDLCVGGHSDLALVVRPLQGR